MSGRSEWAQLPCRGFDTETTGVDVTTDRIVQMALVDITPGVRPTIRTWLINPGIDIPASATAVHGITTEHARTHGMDPGEALFEVTGLIALGLGREAGPLVVMNAPFDLSLLEHENRRHGVDTLSARLGASFIRPIIDPPVLDKHVDPYRKGGRKLTDLCRHYGVRHTGAHDAAADALAACRLWPRIVEKYPRAFTQKSLAELHASQVLWRSHQMDSLRAYFDRKGTEHDGCDGSWPLLTEAAALAADEPAPF